MRRTNISTEHYTSPPVAAPVGLALRADIMLGLPGQTVDSARGRPAVPDGPRGPGPHMDHPVAAERPINDPEYRAEWRSRDDHGVVVATKSFTVVDR